jgi:uncharacterized SAM-binding protein YcdF (DUF218 family)
VTSKEQFIILASNEVLPVKADVVVLLEGDGFNRIKTACDLIKKGRADKLIFSGGIDNPSYGSYTFEKCLPHILAEGIQTDQVVPELRSQHTREQAAFVIEICKEKQWNNLILVASHYHQYRAFLTFLKVLEETGLDRNIRIYNAPAMSGWLEERPWGNR